MNRSTILVLGDLVAFLVFGAVGLTSHEDAVTLTAIARAILPFPIAWFVIAPWFGAFSERAPMSRLAIVWLVAGVVALCGRALIFDRELFNAFFVIALVGNGALLLAWRAAYAAWASRSASRAATG